MPIDGFDVADRDPAIGAGGRDGELPAVPARDGDLAAGRCVDESLGPDQTLGRPLSSKRRPSIVTS